MIRVIEAKPQDLSVVMALLEELRDISSAQAPALYAPSNEEAHAERFHRALGWILDRSQFVLLAYDQTTPVGILHLDTKPFIGDARAMHASSCAFYVREDWRRGPATLALYRLGRRLLRSLGFTAIQSVVLTANPETAILYERHGWEKCAAIVYRRQMELHPGEQRNQAEQAVAASRGAGDRGT